MTLKEITLPDSLKRIEGWAFAICQELETINNISNHLDLVGECILGNTKWYEQNEETDSTGTMKVVRFSDWIVGISPLTDTPSHKNYIFRKAFTEWLFLMLGLTIQRNCISRLR